MGAGPLIARCSMCSRQHFFRDKERLLAEYSALYCPKCEELLKSAEYLKSQADKQRAGF